jgi:hypothetical protein
MTDVASAAALALLITFGWAALAKVLLPMRWRTAVADYGFSRPVEIAAVAGVPAVEVGVVLLLATGRAQAGAALALGLVAAFSMVIARAGARGRTRLPCGCFGGRDEVEGGRMLVRNAALAALGAVVIVAGNDAAVSDIDAGELIPVLLTIAGVAVAAWMVVEASHHLRRRRRA